MRVSKYKSVAQMAKNEEVDKIVPRVKSAQELINVFEEFKKKWGKNYAKKLTENGIVVLELV